MAHIAYGYRELPNGDFMKYCGKCGGVGRIYEYLHREAGICYDCDGRGEFYTVSAEEYAKIMKQREYAAKRRLEKAEKKAAEERKIREETFMTLEIAVGDKIEKILANNLTADFYMNVQSDLSARIPVSIGAIEKAFEMIDQKNNATIVPSGRQEVIGEIVSVKSVADNFSYQERHITKIIVDCGTFRVYGTMPKGMYDFDGFEDMYSYKGRKIKFMATLEPSDDKGFGFFKRPTKAEWVESEA